MPHFLFGFAVALSFSSLFPMVSLMAFVAHGLNIVHDAGPNVFAIPPMMAPKVEPTSADRAFVSVAFKGLLSQLPPFAAFQVSVVFRSSAHALVFVLEPKP